MEIKRITPEQAKELHSRIPMSGKRVGVSCASGWTASYYALAAVLSWAVRSIYFFVFAGFSRAESPEGGGACPWQPPVEFQCTPAAALLVDD